MARQTGDPDKASGLRIRQRGWQLGAKRILDVLVAAVGLTILCPVLAASALTVAITMGRPIFFRQVRPGRFGHPFTLLKFRTMSEDCDSQGKLLSDEHRLTAAGWFLRKTSIDELPQLLNVLAGDLSLVGPRPLLMKYLPLYSQRQATRHFTLPGITGLAQIGGRNHLSWDDKLEMDVWYTENWSFWLDVKILLKTPMVVLRAEGINRTGCATMSEFKGPRAKSSASDLKSIQDSADHVGAVESDA